MSQPLQSIPQLLRNVVDHIHSPQTTFLIHKRDSIWEEISYEKTLLNADCISAYLLNFGINKGDRLALLVENCPEYIYYDQALQQIGCVNTSIYPTLTEAEIKYILNDAQCKSIIVGNHFLLKKIINIYDECPNLKLIVTAYNDTKTNFSIPQDIIVTSILSLIDEGKNLLAKFGKDIISLRNSLNSKDLSSLIYTSGTTGVPKGVMLTHENFIKNIESSLEQIPIIDKDDKFLSFLPLSHVFERTATYHISCYKGCQIAFAQSLELLAKNMSEIKPTVMACVPRLLERIHDKVIRTGNSGGKIKSKIFKWAIKIGEQFRISQEAGNESFFLKLKYGLANRLVFSKIIEKTGGKLKFMISGGAALPKNVGEFFGNLGILILEGYGLTETSPVVAVTELDRQIYGTVGRVIPGIEIGIQNIDNKQIYTIQTHQTFLKDFESEEGEIIIRGHCVMKGYLGKDDETNEVIDDDRWFHTGDIGKFYKGNLKITDRLKNMLVNAYGKNIYPTPVENVYLKSPKIESIFLIGDKKEFITAIIIPSQEAIFEDFGYDKSFFDQDEDFIENPEIKEWLQKDIKKLSLELSKFERIKNFIIKRKPFSIEKEELTPSMKIKRKVVEKKYEKYIDEMYQSDVENQNL